MNPLRYLDREALGTLRTRLRWRWKALLSQRGIAPEDGDESTGMVAFATFVTLVGVGILTFGLWGLARLDPTTDLGVVGAVALTLVMLYSGWKLVRAGMLELSHLAHVGWRPPSPTDETSLIALFEAAFSVAGLVLMMGTLGGVFGALADQAGSEGWFARTWPVLALTSCVGLLVAAVLMGIGKWMFGGRFMNEDSPEEAVEGVKG